MVSKERLTTVRSLLNVFPAKSLIHPAELFRINIRGGMVIAIWFSLHIQCLSPAKKYKLYKSSINKSLHFVQRILSSSPRGQRSPACQTPAKKYKLYKKSINKSLYFAQISLSSSPRRQRVTAQLSLSRKWKNRMTTVVFSAILNPVSRVSTPH